MDRIIVLLILVCRIVPRVYSEFYILNEEPGRWTVFISTETGDCTTESKRDAFPRLYTPPLEGAVPSAPANFSVDHVEREAIEHGGAPDYFYPGMLLGLSPPDDDSCASFLGYEVMIRTNDRRLCLIFDMSDTDVNRRMETVVQELFPMSGLTLYKFTLGSLPPSANNGYGEIIRFVTGRFGFFREGGMLPASVFWVAAISQHVVRDVADQRWNQGTNRSQEAVSQGRNQGTSRSRETVHQEREHGTNRSQAAVHQERDDGSRTLEVDFSRPPPEYGFKRFEIALVPDEVYIEMRVIKVTQFHHIFTDVPPGHYKVSVKPIDDHFSLMGRCLCHYDNGLCSNCLTTQTEVFTVE